MEIKINNKTNLILNCEECGIEFHRRKDEIKKHGDKLCCQCLRSLKIKKMKVKFCNKCLKEKNINEFYKRGNGYCSICKICMSNYNKIWRSHNENRAKEQSNKYRKENREFVRECCNNWKKKNKEHIKKYKREKYYKDRENDFYRLKLQTRNLILKAFKRKGYTKKSKTNNILGCDYNTFINHLLETYKNNYGCEWDKKEKVHIDHIIPISTAKSEEDVIKLNHYTNLQLLKEKDNLQKSNKLDWKLEA